MYRIIALLLIVSAPAAAEKSAFSMGPVFKDYGPVADVQTTQPISPDSLLRHSFDVSAAAPEGQTNASLVSAARFINMHARAGIAVDRIQVAVVVHGKATLEVTHEHAASKDLIAALTEHGVRVIVCGQSAAYYNVEPDNLLPGVEMALSAMTAHALLQQQGYTVNPF